jgi:glycosyltransferase involved in cell wall biosynthesis
MTRVLNVVGGLNRGGAETWMIQVLRGMKHTGIQLDFLVHGDGPFHYQAEAEALGSRVIKCSGLAFPPLYALNLMWILKKYGPYQAIHSHSHHFSGIILLVAALAGVPVRVVQSHSDTRQLDARAGLCRRIYTGIMKRLIWSCATVGTAVSRNAADALFPPQWREDGKWHVMLLGIDPQPFESPVDGDSLRRELGIPAGVTVVGHVGRFGTEKNHKFLLRIAAEYLKAAPETVFLLAGDGPLRMETEREARTLGIQRQICFAGVREDVPALMRGVMDVFVLPSLFEGLPLVLLEAQAAGLPCLLSDTIAEESDFVPSLIHRESLSSPAACWAFRLRRVIEMHAGKRSPGYPDLVGIDRSIEGLMHCYSVPNVEFQCGLFLRSRWHL